MIASKTQAIKTALRGDWNTAIELNQKLLKNDPNDIEALNRLAFANVVLGKIKNAKAMYQKVLKLDSQNPIAIKNLKRLQKDPRNKSHVSFLIRNIDSLFLEESGKTKIIELVNVGQPKVIANLIAGQLLELRIKRLKIFVLDDKQRYVGVLPDNLGKRLIKFLKGGNTYEAYVRAVSSNRVIIFLRETKRANRFRNQSSFASTEKPKLFFDKNSPFGMAKPKNSEIQISEEENPTSLSIKENSS